MKKKPIILAVDDEEQNLEIMEALLSPKGYDVRVASDGETALAMVKEIWPDVILLDVLMPRVDGFQIARRLKQDSETRHIPVVMVTALMDVDDRIKAMEAGADDFLSKPVDKVELWARVNSLCKVKELNDHQRNYQIMLEEQVEEKTQALQNALAQVKDASMETILRLTRAAEYKDNETGAHIQRMSKYCATIARTLGWVEGEIETLLYAAPMHDIGKIGIPDKILLKPGRLEGQEMDLMRLHTSIGKAILQNSTIGFIRMAEVIAITHHEKWDGTGYPNKLRGEGVPLVGRIAALADVFDALTSKRPYKEAFSIDRSFAIIREGKGSHFDPHVVDAFFSSEKEIISIFQEISDDGHSLLELMNDGIFVMK